MKNEERRELEPAPAEPNRSRNAVRRIKAKPMRPDFTRSCDAI